MFLWLNKFFWIKKSFIYINLFQALFLMKSNLYSCYINPESFNHFHLKKIKMKNSKSIATSFHNKKIKYNSVNCKLSNKKLTSNYQTFLT